MIEEKQEKIENKNSNNNIKSNSHLDKNSDSEEPTSRNFNMIVKIFFLFF